MKYLFLLFIPISLFASEYDFKYGIGIFKASEVKQFSIAYQDKFVNNKFVKQYEVGFWGDSRNDLERKSSGFISSGIGIPVETKNIMLQSIWGLALITSPDSYLGGIFQFKQDLFIGVKGNNKNTFGINYSHISSAGIETPNIGRDVLSVKIGVNF